MDGSGILTIAGAYDNMTKQQREDFAAELVAYICEGDKTKIDILNQEALLYVVNTFVSLGEQMGQATLLDTLRGSGATTNLLTILKKRLLEGSNYEETRAVTYMWAEAVDSVRQTSKPPVLN
jgi:hypothetical protein